jgi:hypothetical protein
MSAPDSPQETQPPVQEPASTPDQKRPDARLADAAKKPRAGDPPESADSPPDEPGYGHGV